MWDITVACSSNDCILLPAEYWSCYRSECAIAARQPSEWYEQGIGTADDFPAIPLILGSIIDD